MKGKAVTKRLFDVMVSAVGGVVLAPVLGVVALLVRQKLGSPVLFKQVRPGPCRPSPSNLPPCYALAHC